ncbi:MAG: radical SAM protein [Armatimonadota bacterium]|nr:radical SAM protein [Armatimonadota bacterium]
MAADWPAYLSLHETGELQRRAETARELLSECTICPRECHVDRRRDAEGYCGVRARALVSSAAPHFGEERPLVGSGGSGTIFFAGCSLGCIFCQNYEISHERRGQEVSSDELANIMVGLQGRGCHNINFVTPTHVVPQILDALGPAIDQGLNLPLVYNCGGYESVSTLRLLDGVVDIYMPDAKYADSEVADRFSGAPDYPDVMRAALTEMHRQVGDLQIDDSGLARRGLLVRHLVLPEGLAGTEEITQFLASLSEDTYVNVMAQYRPCYRAGEFQELSRHITRGEYREAVRAAYDAGLHRLDERPLRFL